MKNKKIFFIKIFLREGVRTWDTTKSHPPTSNWREYPRGFTCSISILCINLTYIHYEVQNWPLHQRRLQARHQLLIWLLINKHNQYEKRGWQDDAQSRIWSMDRDCIHQVWDCTRVYYYHTLRTTHNHSKDSIAAICSIILYLWSVIPTQKAQSRLHKQRLGGKEMSILYLIFAIRYLILITNTAKGPNQPRLTEIGGNRERV